MKRTLWIALLATALSACGGGTELTDNAGIVISPKSSFVTAETGTSVNFEVTLNTEPSDKVTIALNSSDLSEGEINKETLTFTTTNWNIAQSVTIMGIDDHLGDGNQSYKIEIHPATSADTSYNGLDANDIQVTNLDDDVAGVSFGAVVDIITSESGDSIIIGGVLNTEPAADVTVPLSVMTGSPNPEATLSKNSITFTSTNWSTPQFINITGVDDNEMDGDQSFTVVVGAASSSDISYNGLDGTDLTGINKDNDNASIKVYGPASTLTSEAGVNTNISIALNSKPVADVTINITSSNTAEATVNSYQLIFTSSDWNIAKHLIVTGKDDAQQDGNQNYNISFTVSSADPHYNGLAIPAQTLTNIDDDVAGIVVDSASLSHTSEAGKTDTFEIGLSSQPTGSVAVVVTSTSPTEVLVSSATQPTPAPSVNISWTPQTWETKYNITTTGQNDRVFDVDKTVALNITVDSANTSDTSGYAALGNYVRKVMNHALISEGTSTLPVSVDNTETHKGQVGVYFPSYYQLSGLNAGSEYALTLSDIVDPVDVTIYQSGNNTTPVCVTPGESIADCKFTSVSELINVEITTRQSATGGSLYTLGTEYRGEGAGFLAQGTADEPVLLDMQTPQTSQVDHTRSYYRVQNADAKQTYLATLTELNDNVSVYYKQGTEYVKAMNCLPVTMKTDFLSCAIAPDTDGSIYVAVDGKNAVIHGGSAFQIMVGK